MADHEEFVNYCIDLLKVDQMRLDRYLPLLSVFHAGTVEKEGFDIPTNYAISYILEKLSGQQIDLGEPDQFFNPCEISQWREHRVTTNPSVKILHEIVDHLITGDL